MATIVNTEMEASEEAGLSAKRDVICKFAKVRETEEGIGARNRDTLFGGPLSLEREAYLFRMIRRETGVATPEVYGVHDSPYGTFILLERMRGVSHKVCMAQSGYSKSCFLDSMRFLGNDFARIQSVRFPSFGNILADAEIEPAGLRNFSDRFRSVIEMRLECCDQKGVLSPAESLELAAFFDEKLEALRPHFDAAVSPPVLVFTDMHAENFFTDARGVPTAYFDLESAQAAPAALEFYGFRFFLFNFYDALCFREAEDAFFRGYREAGGLYAPRNRTDDEAIDFLAACRLLELAQSYWAYVDGIRDGWGEAMKHLLFQYVESGSVDYNALGAIWRQRDGQPERPRKP